MHLELNPIGIIHSSCMSKENTPVQGCLSPDTVGQIEIFSEFADGLKDIDTFSHIILLYPFDRAGEVVLVRPTFFDDSPHGVFASRHPCRPNGLGLSIVRLLERSDRFLNVGGIDVLDNTPLLDVKPYIPRFDCFPDASNGWVESTQLRPKPLGRE
jgi:tRNA (adenine37-N6)-methyltransferase